MASLLEIGGSSPNKIKVGNDAVRVVTMDENWAVWAKFDDPSYKTVLNPLQPFTTNSISGLSLSYIPTQANPSVARAESHIVLDMKNYNMDIAVYLERWFPPDTTKVDSIWRFDVSLKDDKGNVSQSLIDKYGYSYTAVSNIGLDVFYLNVGINDVFTGADNEFCPYFEFKRGNTSLKRVEAPVRIMSKSSYLNGYPSLSTLSLVQLSKTGNLAIRVAYVTDPYND